MPKLVEEKIYNSLTKKDLVRLLLTTKKNNNDTMLKSRVAEAKSLHTQYKTAIMSLRRKIYFVLYNKRLSLAIKPTTSKLYLVSEVFNKQGDLFFYDGDNDSYVEKVYDDVNTEVFNAMCRVTLERLLTYNKDDIVTAVNDNYTDEQYGKIVEKSIELLRSMV